jgi:type II secretory pathway component GspD/PulD (secretin)
LGQVAAPAAAEPPKPAGPPPPPAALPPKPAAPPATVLIAPSEGSILMASDDIEALDQLESLVRAIGQRTGYSGRNFSVFPVRNTSATRAAATLQQLFRSNQPASPRSYLTAANSLVIVPDERLNLVLVQGNRSDRATIESMLRVLDSAETPAVLGAHQPRIVAIENTKAARVEQLLRTVFRAQMATQGGGAAGATPGWLATDLAVDDATNSLIVMAPPQLAESICQFAQQLDKAAGDDPSRNISIVRLKSANAARVQSVLDSVLKKRSGSTSVRSSSYPRSASSGSGSSGAASSQHRPP